MNNMEADMGRVLQVERDRLRALYAGMKDCHGWYDHTKAKPNPEKNGKIELKDIAETRDRPPTPDLWDRHLQGTYPVGIYPRRDDGMCLWGMIDIDQYGPGALVAEIAARRVKVAGMPLVVCRSKSGGAHVYLFLTDWTPSMQVGKALRVLAEKIGYRDVKEVYPPTTGGQGNWLTMPYFGCWSEEGPTRYGVTAGGKGMMLGTFLNIAEASRVNQAKLAELLRAPARTEDGPTQDEARRQLEWRAGLVCGAAPLDANNQLSPAAFDMGKWCRDTGLPEEEARAEMLRAWMVRKGNDRGAEAEFNDVWQRQFKAGQKMGEPATRGERKQKKIALVTNLADVIARKIDWCWKPYLARGVVTMFSGPGGQGKSQVTLDLAARLTKVGVWPDGTPIPQEQMGRVLLLSAEDGKATTIKPRLVAMGGDPSRVDILDGKEDEDGNEKDIDFDHDTDVVDWQLAQHDDYALVIVDPVTAYAGKTNTHMTSVVRSLIRPLQKMAEKHNVAVLCIGHPPKGRGRAAADSFSGSKAYIDAARVAWVADVEHNEVEDEDGKIRNEETGRVFFAISKTNIGPGGPEYTWAFRKEIVCLGENDEIEVSRIEWLGKVRRTADQVVGYRDEVGEARPGPKPDERERAEKFLLDILADGPKLRKEIEVAAKEAKITLPTLANARKALGNRLVIEQEKHGARRSWWRREDAPMQEDLF